jgi:hypothetical protein
MILGIGTIFHNSYSELKRLSESLPPNSVDIWLCIDGIFNYSKEQNPELPDLSNDGSRELLLNQKNIEQVHIFDMPRSSEFDKRNKYLEMCKQYNIDTLIITDSDEFFIVPEGVTPERSWDIFKRNFEMLASKNGYKHNVFSIRTLDIATNTDSVRARCWYNPADMRYVHNSHYHYYNTKTEQKDLEHCIQNRLTYCQSTRGVIKGLTLAHDHSLRSKEQLQLREQYQRFLVTYESLVQNGYTPEEAHKLAKSNPSKDYNPTS